MRKLLLINTAFLVVLGLSCKKTGVPDVTPPSLQEIAATTLAGDYYVENIATSEFKIPVGITTVSKEPRTINFTYTSTTGAAAGVQYTAPASVTIPAGKALDTLRIKGIFAGYPAGRKDVLKIKISGGSLPRFTGKDSFMLSLQRYCSVVLANLNGTYPNTTEPAYGPYTTGVSGATSTGATTATVVLANLFDDGWGAINANLDWANPASFKVTIPIQSIGKSYAGTPAYVRTSTAASAVNTFSSCDNTITVSIDIVTSTGAVHPNVFGGTVTNYKIIMRKS